MRGSPFVAAPAPPMAQGFQSWTAALVGGRPPAPSAGNGAALLFVATCTKQGNDCAL